MEAQNFFTPEGLTAFLSATLPESDLASYPPELFRRFAEHALMLRAAAPWCRDQDPEIFAHYVLCPRVNDEDLSFHRKLFFDELWPRVRDLPDAESRVLEVNRWCHENASYAAQDRRTASPLTVWRSGAGRCGEESGFLVSALRSVGIPARQVYVPRWSHCDDNHAWAEALCGDRWRFLGACEPEPVLDRGWFNSAASRAVLVHSRIFGRGRSPLHGEFLCREGAVSWFNQTSRYAVTRVRTLRAVHEGAPAAGAVFRIHILNEAALHRIVSLTADGNGEACVTLGLGDVHVLALWRGLRAEAVCGPEGVTLSLAEPESRDTGWVSRDFRAPEAAPPLPPLSAPERAERARVLREGAELRRRRIGSLCPPPECRDGLVRAGRGNWRVLSDFLRADGDPRRRALLESLTEKDLRDVTPEVLEDHLRNAPAPGKYPAELYVPYVLCPRIGTERLTAWRGPLRDVLPGLTPAELWRELKGRVETEGLRDYANLIRTPLEVWRTRRGDARSLRTLYAACLRARGVPARLRPLDGAPEYWDRGRFRVPEPEETAALSITGNRDTAFGLSRRTEEGWQILELPLDAGALELPAGRYRLITSARLPGGDQLAASRDFTLAPGDFLEAELFTRSYSLRESLTDVPMPALPAVGPGGVEVPDLFRAFLGEPALFCWIEPGAEPTEHLLGELAAAPPPVRVVLLPGGSAGAEDLTRRVPGAAVLRDDRDYDRELTARRLGCDPDLLPLTVLCNSDGRAACAFGGYRVGLVRLLTDAARCFQSN